MHSCSCDPPLSQLTRDLQNLRDEVAMDVDEYDEGTQRVKRVPDYGIEVDFEALGEIDADVRLMLAIFLCHSLNTPLSRKIPRRP